MKILKAPLLHFIVLGALLFAFYQFFDPQADEPGDKEIVVSEGRIGQLSEIFIKTWHRPPTKEELQGLIDDFIKEEIYYREAVDAGLDKDDTLIRRRMRQKMEFLTEDMALTQPQDGELQKFAEAHPERFKNPGNQTFQQIFFNPEKLGDNPDAAIEKTKAMLAGGELPEGHPTLLPADMESASVRQIAGVFGEEFGNGVATIPVGKWSGPVKSTFGVHFVRVKDRKEGTMPPFEEIREQVLREWQHEQRKVFRGKFDQELLKKYEISVKWPAGQKPQG